jgi:NADH:ubiquinone oxidoreductase subunit 3 (subunit A)
MLEQYFPLAIYVAVALTVAASVLLLSRLLGPRHPTERKLDTYESGITPVSRVGPRFSVKFYLVAMLFMIFDVEAVSFYPWAILLRRLRGFGLVEMAMFILVMAIGYAYVWRRGGFQWQE